MPFSRGSSQPRDQTHIISCGSCIACGFFTTEPLGKPIYMPGLLQKFNKVIHKKEPNRAWFTVVNPPPKHPTNSVSNLLPALTWGARATWHGEEDSGACPGRGGLEVGRVLGEEGAEGSQYIGSSVQTCQKAGPAQGWAPGNWPPQPKRPRQVLATGHGAALLSGAEQEGTEKTFGLLRQS